MHRILFYFLLFLKRRMSLFAMSESHLSTYLCTPRLMMSELLPPDTGYFRLFSLFSFWRASARLHLKKKKFLENFSVAGACSFHGADFCHNDKEAAVNTRRIYKAFAKVRAKIRTVKTDESSNIISHGLNSLILNIFSYP